MYFPHFLDTTVETATPLEGEYDLALVALSYLVAALASYSALSLAHRNRSVESRSASILWNIAGAFAMGCGVWGMHFIGMLSFQLPVPVYYDVPTTFLSAIPAMLAGGVALWVINWTSVSTPRLLTSGVLMGGGIGTMHFVGMSGMRMPATALYDPYLFAGSIFIAVVLATVALYSALATGFTVTKSNKIRRSTGAIFMGLSVTGMHYTAMAGVNFFPADMEMHAAAPPDPAFLGTSIGIVVIIILILAVAAVIVNRSLTVAKYSVSQTRKQLLTILDTMVEGVITFDDRGVIESINASAEQVFGYQAGEIVGKNFRMLMPSEFGPGQDHYMAQLAEIGSSNSVDKSREVEGSRKDGTTFPLRLSMSEMEIGGSHKFVVTVQDVTEQKSLQVTLSEREAMFRAITENTTDFTLVIGIDGCFTYASPAVKKLSGYSPEEVVGQSYEAFAVDAEGDSVNSIFAKAMNRPGETLRAPHFRSLHRDGHIIDYEALVTNMLDVPGVDGIVVTLRNISERKEAEAALSKSERNLRNITNLTPVGIYQSDTDGKITYVNERWRKILGVGDGDSLGDNWIKAMHPEDRDTVIKAWKKIVDGEFEEYQMDCRIIRPDGSVAWLISQATREYGETGELLGFVGTITDITDLKNAEQEVVVAMENAEAANRAKSEFLSSMSHELRTPMNAVLGFAQLLEQEDVAFTDSQRDYLQEILRSGSHMIELINDVLDLAKIEDQDISVVLEDQKPETQIVACLAMVDAAAKQNGIVITNNTLSGDLPSIRIDTLRFRQALLNFLSNAVKYNSRNGNVTVDCIRRDNGALRIRVTDTGPGIPEDMWDRVFDPFERLGAENSSTPGTGIGLTVSKQLIERMGGDIGFESTVGKGTTFWIDVPMSDPVGELQD